MAHYHCTIRRICRKGKGSSAATYDYITRTRKYKGKEDLLYHESGGMPSWAVKHPREYWYQADRNERANGVLARSIIVALPNEVQDLEIQKKIVRDIISSAIGKERVSWTYAIHDKKENGNVHAHLLIGERVQDGIERTPENFFRRYNKKIPTKGGCRKTEKFAKKTWLRQVREKVAEIVNAAYVRLGIDAHIDHRSYKDQGLDKIPTVHKGPTLMEMEKRGVHSYVLDHIYVKEEEAAETLSAEQQQEEKELSAKLEKASTEILLDIRYLRKALSEYDADRDAKKAVDAKYSKAEYVCSYLKRSGRTSAELKIVGKGVDRIYCMPSTGDGSVPVVYFRPRSGPDAVIGAGVRFDATEHRYTIRSTLSEYTAEVNNLSVVARKAKEAAAREARERVQRLKDEVDARYYDKSVTASSYCISNNSYSVNLKVLTRGNRAIYCQAPTGDGSQPIIRLSLDALKEQDVAAWYSQTSRRAYGRRDTSDFDAEAAQLKKEYERKEAEKKRRAEKKRAVKQAEEEADARYVDALSVADYQKSTGKSRLYGHIVGRGKTQAYAVVATGDGSQPVIRMERSCIRADDVAVSVFYDGSVYGERSATEYEAEKARLERNYQKEQERREAEEKRRAEEQARQDAEKVVDERNSSALSIAEYRQTFGRGTIYGKIVGRGKTQAYAVVATGNGSQPVIRVDKGRIRADDVAITVFYGESVYGGKSTQAYDAEIKRLEGIYQKEQARKAVKAADDRYKDVPSAAEYFSSNPTQSIQVPLKIIARGARYVYCAVPVGDGEAPVVSVYGRISAADTAVTYYVGGGAYGESSLQAYDAEVVRLKAIADENRSSRAEEEEAKPKQPSNHRRTVEQYEDIYDTRRDEFRLPDGDDDYLGY